MRKTLVIWQLGTLFLLGCIGLEKTSHAPSPLFEGKSFSLMLLEAPADTSFRLEALNRLLWQWNESSPWFRKQLVGVAPSVPPAGSVASLLASLDEGLRVRSELLVILQPRKFRWNEGGYHRAPNPGSNGGPLLDEAEFLVSLADVKQAKELGTFRISVARRSEQDTPILEKLAYEIAVKAGFGWQISN